MKNLICTKHKKGILFLLIFAVLVLSVFALRESYASTISREKMQDAVVSTAMSYLNNKTYSDYGQTGMDNSSTYYWRQFTNNPEMVNRINYYYIDCSSFVSSVYMHSLGYDFSDYYELASSNTYYQDFTKYSVNSKARYRKMYTNFGKGLSTSYFTSIGNKLAAEASNLTTMTAGKEYINDSNTNTSILAYYYKVSGNETTTQKSKIRTNIKNTLKPGDILVYRNKNTSTGSITGHAMMYVGDAIDSSKGFIHSTGTDYKPDESPVAIGDDSFSVRYEGIEKRINDKIFLNSSTSTSYAFTILRPINKFCTKDSCVIPECSSTNCTASDLGNMNKNVNARTELSKLRVDQYVRINKSYNDNLVSNDLETKTVTKSLSKYNSVNQGDIIDYRVYLENRSQISFCLENGAYTTQSGCEGAGYTWKTSDKEKIVYKNLAITSIVPKGVEFVSCNWESYCTYDSANRKVIWELPSLSNYITLSYSAKITSNENIVNEGMKIKTESGNVLELSPITTKVNPTLNGINMDLMNKQIEKFDELVDDKKITYDSSSSVYKIDYSSLTSANISQANFIRSLYYNTFGIDIGYTTNANIKAAIFDKSGDNYAKKTDSEVSALTNTNDININKMLVKGMYGGRYLRGNDNSDRANYIRTSDLEYGDIIVFYYTSSSVAQYMSTFMFLGLDSNGEPQFVRFESDSGITIYNSISAEEHGKTGWRFFKELYSRDLFVVLRPSQVYGTTVNLNYNGATTKGDSLYVAHDVYRNLNIPTKESYVITLNYNKTVNSSYPISLISENVFNGWYSDANLTNKVTNTTKLISTDSHTLTAKWSTNSVILPSPVITGYKLEGWYKNSDLTTKVGNAGATYIPTSTGTLYANWQEITYQIKYNANGGTGTMENSYYTYDEEKTLSENKFVKEDYIFKGWSTEENGEVKYQEKEIVKNLTTVNNEIINLYAVWEYININKFVVEVEVENGIINETSKIVNQNSDALFTINANKGYSSPIVSCNNDQISTIEGNTLKIENVTSDAKCEVIYRANEYQIKYNANGGIGTMENSIHTYDVSKGLEKNTFTRTGYEFVGWSKTQTGIADYINEETVRNLTEENNGVVNLYAVWKPVTYQIKYNLDGGSTVNPETYTIETPNFKLNNPTKEGHKFIGWTTSTDSNKKLEVEIVTGTTGDKEYTANYEIAKYSVVYKSDENGNITGKTTEEILYQNNPTGTTQEAKEGYEDLKWAVDKDVALKDGTIINKGESITEEQIQNIVVKEDITITIYHYQIKYNVSYESSEDGKVEQSNEEVAQNANPLGVKISPNKGYKLSYFIADKDVELNDGTVIKTGEKIIEEHLLEIVIKEDIKLKAMYEVATYIVKYESEENGNITGITSEEISYQNSPLGTIVIPNKNYEVLSWVADKDVWMLFSIVPIPPFALYFI